MKSIKIFMCCHKPFEIVPAMCTPIQCGSDLAPLLKGILHDNEGEHISWKNKEYCELTAHYYAWKNVQADFYGFCHYRRFFAVNKQIRYPYIAKKAISKEEYKNFFGTQADWENIMDRCDILIPRKEDMGISVEEHYCSSPYHYQEDLTLFLELLEAQAPQLLQAAKEYLSQRRQYFCNMFVMNKMYFNRYCEILFPILDEFDKKKSIHEGFQANRTDGYIGELFTGIYVTYCQAYGARVIEVPRVDIKCSLGKRFLYVMLPPESRRRFLIKKLVKTWKIARS